MNKYAVEVRKAPQQGGWQWEVWLAVMSISTSSSTINSYADLADALDELPEGTVVQMLLPTRSPLGHAGPTDVYRYRRTQTGYEFTSRDQGWRRSESCSTRAPDELDAVSFRIFPSSEVER